MNSLDLVARHHAVRDGMGVYQQPILPNALLELLLGFVTIDCIEDYTFSLPDGHVPLAVIDGDCYHVRRWGNMEDKQYLICNNKSTGIESSTLDRVMKVNDNEILVASLDCFHIWNRKTGEIHTTLHGRFAYFFRGCVYYLQEDRLMCDGQVVLTHNVRFIHGYGDCLNLVDLHANNSMYGESFPKRDCITMYKWQNKCFIVTRESLEVENWHFVVAYVCNVIAFDHLLLVQCSECSVVWDLQTLTVTPIDVPGNLICCTRLCVYDDSTVIVLK